MRYFLALLLAAACVRAYAARPAAPDAPFLVDLEAARAWAAQTSVSRQGPASDPMGRLAVLQIRLKSCSDAETCGRMGHSAVEELKAVFGTAASKAKPVFDRLEAECDDFAAAKAAKDSQRFRQVTTKVGNITLAALGIQYPAPSDVNPMLTDPGYRPHPGGVSALDADGNIREAQQPDQAGPPPDPTVHWDAEVFGGGNINQPNQISLQDITHANTGGQSGIVLTGGPSGRPPYYAARIERWKGGSAWEIEGINTDNLVQSGPQNGQDNDIMRGYDHFLVNRAYELWGLIWRVGAGVVITHPEPTAEQVSQHNSGSYYFSGVGGQAAVAKRLFFTEHAFATIEAKINTDVPQVSNPNNTVTPPPFSANGVVGIGFKF